MPENTNFTPDTDYPQTAEIPLPQQSWETEKPEVTALIQSQAALTYRVKLLTGLLVGTILLSLGSLVWSGRQAEPPADADTIALESPEAEVSDEEAKTDKDAAALEADSDETLTSDTQSASQANQSAQINQKLAQLERQIEALSQADSGNVSAQVSDAKTQIATVSADLDRAEAEIADLRNLTTALRQAVDQQLAAPVPEPAQPVPDTIPEPGQ